MTLSDDESVLSDISSILSILFTIAARSAASSSTHDKTIRHRAARVPVLATQLQRPRLPPQL